MTAIVEIEGVGEVYAEKLESCGISTVESLLEKCASPDGRKEVADATDISDKLILSWANRADLARIKGVSTQYADLLEAAGVDTVPELARRNPQNLYQKLKEANEEKELVRRLPGEEQVAEWIRLAGTLPRVMTY